VRAENPGVVVAGAGIAGASIAAVLARRSGEERCLAILPGVRGPPCPSHPKAAPAGHAHQQEEPA
jgi:hypothetical protein